MALLPDRYRLDNLGFLFEHPGALVGEVHALGNRVNRAVHERRYADVGHDVTSEAWDTLFILDACRYDVYADRHGTMGVGGRLESRLSSGSESWEYLRANFDGGRHHDTVYVTANPHAYKLSEGTFHATWNLLEDRWDPELQTVRPEDVADAAREAHAEYPDKRLVVHFMQPHFPFIGEKGRQLDSGGLVYHIDQGFADAGGAEPTAGDQEEAITDGAGADAQGDDGRDGDERDMLLWGKLTWGLLDVEPVWEAYCENLDLALPVVADLLADLDGRSVVTSDHGNLFGERLWPVPTRAYGHPPGIFAEPLRRVPWHVVPGERRETTADPPAERRSIGEDVAKKRLQDLGYVE